MNLCKHYISINYILIKNLAWTLWPVLQLAQGKHENKHPGCTGCSWRGRRRQDNEWCGSGDKLQISQPAQPAQPSPGLSVNADQRSVELFYTAARQGAGTAPAAAHPQNTRQCQVRCDGRAAGPGLHHGASVPRAVHFVILIPS